MPRTEEITIYKFDELSDKAKEKARDWYRESMLTDDWWDGVYEWADEVFKIIGITSGKYVKTMNNTMRRTGPAIYFSGFNSQGDGACFEGSYVHLSGAPEKLRAEYPTEETLHKIADELQAVQARHGYQLSATSQHLGRHCHEHSVLISVFADGDYAEEDVAEEVRKCMRDLMRWIYDKLEQEQDYLLSDEYVDESIRANEHEFEADGSLYR